MRGEKVTLWGDGTQIRELIFVDDFIRATALLNEQVDNDIVNIGAGSGFAIKTFAEKLCAIVGYDSSKIEYDTSKYVGAKAKVLVTDKLKSFLPDFELTDLDLGLRKTVEWYMEAFESGSSTV